MVRASSSGLLDAYGRPVRANEIAQARSDVIKLRNQIRAKFDAAQTFTGNEGHWSNADHFDPHQVASQRVRRILRSRSRYEVIENNPYLKGTVLTMAYDFVGKGPKLQVTDKRISKERRQRIEQQFAKWSKLCKLRQKLWRMRLAKIVDGEGFMRAYADKSRAYRRYPLQLNFQVFECDRCSSPEPAKTRDLPYNQIDGVRFDDYENPLQYHVLNSHPGGGSSFWSSFFYNSNSFEGKWYDSRYIIHWFRQDRGWLRGIPETTPSLPLCALLRRYTLAIVRHAEVAADFTAIIEAEGPGAQAAWTDGRGNVVEDDPFDTFPIEMGMIMNLPWGYKMSQLKAVPLGIQFDQFVGAILREITRPLLAPYNIAAGTSKDSNMASGMLDQNIYKGGQEAEREDCEDFVLDKILDLWWGESLRVPGYLGDDMLSTDQSFRDEPPEHVWRWDRIGLDHTDPSKAATALQILHDAKFLTDRDIQEIYYNRDVEQWREEAMEDAEFRASLPLAPEAQAKQDATKEKAKQKKTQASRIILEDDYGQVT